MADTACTRLEWINDSQVGEVALVVFDQPDKSANILSASVLDEIERHLDAIAKQPKTAGLVFVSSKPGMFIAGADLTEFAAGLDQPKEAIVATSRRGQLLFGRLAELPYVSIAAIDGICVGGGAELAVWCDRRILTDNPKTQLGFPEVKLGLFPGWGGTARTPRMIGLANAVELVTGGESVNAAEAAKLGLADDICAATTGAVADSPLVQAAMRMIAAEQASQQFKEDRQHWSQPIGLSDTELAFLGATASAVIQQKTGGHYPAPMAALELMLEASYLDLNAACELEAEKFAPLFGSPVNRSLLNVFFLTDSAKKSQAAGTDAGKVSSCTVVGAGIMGQGIAAANVKRGIATLLSDARPDALATGVSGVVRETSYNKQTKAADADLAIKMAGLVSASTLPQELGGTDVIIEAIIENADAKRSLFTSLEPHLGEQTILCSNTSTIPITQLAEGLKSPDRFCGLHFFNPVRKMPLVEVIRGERTSDDTVAAMTTYARQLGKTPVVVNDGPGFLVNRLLLPYMNEAALMVAEGVPIKAIERAAKEFGMPMGPLTLYDVVGLDTCVHAGRVMHAAFPDRVVPATLVEKLVEADRLGQKNSRGFFDYPPAKPGKPPRGVPSEEVAKTIAAEASGAQAEDTPIAERLLLPMLVEANRAIEEGIVGTVQEVDLSLILGIGFPPHQGGLFFWADAVGPKIILEKLKPLQPLGKRFEPTAMMQEAAKSGSYY